MFVKYELDPDKLHLLETEIRLPDLDRVMMKNN